MSHAEAVQPSPVDKLNQDRITPPAWSARIAVVFTLTVAALAAAEFMLAVQYRGLVGELRSGVLLPDALDRVKEMYVIAQTLNALTLAALVFGGAAWATWLYRARSNAQRLWPGTFQRAPGWAIAGWFVPVLSLRFPKQVVDDTWAATDRFLAGPGVPAQPRPRLVYA